MDRLTVAKGSRCATLHRLGMLLLSVCLSGCVAVVDETNHVFDLVKRTTSREPSYFQYLRNDKSAQKHARRLGAEAWNEVLLARPDLGASPDYADGFKEGFADYFYRGGAGEPPLIPPRNYWNRSFQNHLGKVVINDWYDGFRHGAQDCKARGIREMVTVPTSLPPKGEDPTGYEDGGQGLQEFATDDSETGAPDTEESTRLELVDEDDSESELDTDDENEMLERAEIELLDDGDEVEELPLRPRSTTQQLDELTPDAFPDLPFDLAPEDTPGPPIDTGEVPGDTDIDPLQDFDELNAPQDDFEGLFDTQGRLESPQRSTRGVAQRVENSENAKDRGKNNFPIPIRDSQTNAGDGNGIPAEYRNYSSRGPKRVERIRRASYQDAPSAKTNKLRQSQNDNELPMRMVLGARDTQAPQHGSRAAHDPDDEFAGLEALPMVYQANNTSTEAWQPDDRPAGPVRFASPVTEEKIPAGEIAESKTKWSPIPMGYDEFPKKVTNPDAPPTRVHPFEQATTAPMRLGTPDGGVVADDPWQTSNHNSEYRASESSSTMIRWRTRDN